MYHMHKPHFFNHAYVAKDNNRPVIGIIEVYLLIDYISAELGAIKVSL